MPKSIFLYFKRPQIDAAVERGLLDHVASDQKLGRIVPGDTLWIIGPGKQDANEIVTIGALKVGEVTSQREAERRFGHTVWDARYHIFCPPDEPTRAREVPLSPILGELTFMSKRRPTLNLNRGLGQQLQTIRNLTLESVAKLDSLWGETPYRDFAQNSDEEAKELGELDARREVLVRREQQRLRKLLFGNSKSARCAICGEELSIAFLVAAHVKRRADCSEEERRDHRANIAAMCFLGCDALFECGLIKVRNGKIVFDAREHRSPKLDSVRRTLDGRTCSAWNPVSQKYFDWHFAQSVR